MKQRLLGGQEVLFYGMNAGWPMHFIMVAEIEGKTTRTDWQVAVEHLQSAHPMLRMSIVAEKDNLIFNETDKPLRLDIAELNDKLNLRSEIEQELETGFQSDRGPLARIRLLHSSGKSVVIFSAHHSIADAFSLSDLIDDLLGLLSGKKLTDFPLQLSVDEQLGFSNEGLGAVLNRQITPGQALPHSFLLNRPEAKVDFLSFSEDLTQKLTTRAKAEATSVHGILQAAAASALSELSFDSRRPAWIMSPFSVRKDLNIGRDCGLFIDTKIIPVPTDDQEDFWEVAREAKNGLADVHSAQFLHSSAENLRGLVSHADDLTQFIKDNFNFDIMLSNLGRVSFTNTSERYKVNALLGPFIISALNNAQAIGVTTLNGKLTLTHSSRHLLPGLLPAIKSKISTFTTIHETSYSTETKN